jgi:hypothetical protein
LRGPGAGQWHARLRARSALCGWQRLGPGGAMPEQASRGGLGALHLGRFWD